MPDSITIRIEKYANGGFGLGFHDGKAIFVPYCTPGDRLQVSITDNRKNHAFALIDDIITPSPLRVTPECPNFGQCGGCHFLHVDYEEELNAKSGLLKETLLRIGRIPEEDIPGIEVIHGGRYQYRTHATLQCDTNGIGFFKRESHTVEPFPPGGCRLLALPITGGLENIDHPGNTELKTAIDSEGRCHFSKGEHETITEIEKGITYQRDIYSFFQANGKLRSTMLQLASDMCRVDEEKSFIDIGCGVGFFTLYLARHARKGTGIDIVQDSIRWADHNASLNNIENVEFHRLHGDMLHPYRDQFHTVLVDPPRQGLNTKTRKTIKAMSPVDILYVSCNPVTFARDNGDLIDSGYNLKRLVMLDMFPGTHHTEVMGLLTR